LDDERIIRIVLNQQNHITLWHLKQYPL
jgi:hypothetical protein